MCSSDLLPEAEIYVLNGLAPGSGASFAAHRLMPVLGSHEELAEWAAFSEAERPAALHVDTGMNRLGLRVPDALALAGDPLLARAGIRLLMSHLVSAEKPDEPVNVRQIDSGVVGESSLAMGAPIEQASPSYQITGFATDDADAKSSAVVIDTVYKL